DQDEWRFRPAQTLAPLPDGYIAAEEDVLAFGVESLKTRERGAETRAVPDLAREDPALFEPVAQASFDLLCEFVRPVVGQAPIAHLGPTQIRGPRSCAPQGRRRPRAEEPLRPARGRSRSKLP